MTAKEYLKQAYRLDQRIDSDISEKERLREMAYRIRASGFDGHYNPNHPTEASYIRTLEKVWKLEATINSEIDKLVDLKEQIRSVIDAVTDPNERMVLCCRYIHNMTWEQIGDILHADSRTMRRWHEKALQHVVLPKSTISI